jgi:hypothetical protein
MKINQLIPILKSAKDASLKGRSQIYALIQKNNLFNGLTRTYQPREEDGFVYPSESQPVQQTAQKAIAEFVEVSKRFIDLAATQDWANSTASADVVVDGVAVLSVVPVTYLLFLEKQIVDLRTFVNALPVLDSDQEWERDPNTGYYRTPQKQTVKTKKIMKPVVLYEATQEHPAQVKEATEDIVEGTWSLVNFSGALSKLEKDELAVKVQKLHDAVLAAREEANGAIAAEIKTSDAIFSYLFG